jgi:chorismate mutase
VAVRAVRGATQLDADEREHLLERTAELVRSMLDANDLTSDDLISIVFTVTPDLHCEFPAYAVRSLGITDVPLLCSTEIGVPGALARVVRVMAHVETDIPRADVKHVYLHGAKTLRTDLTGAVRAEDAAHLPAARSRAGAAAPGTGLGWPEPKDQE